MFKISAEVIKYELVDPWIKLKPKLAIIYFDFFNEISRPDPQVTHGKELAGPFSCEKKNLLLYKADVFFVLFAW